MTNYLTISCNQSLQSSMANRLTYIRDTIYESLDKLKDFDVRREFDLDSWKQDNQYIHMRLEGEDFDAESYENSHYRNESSSMVLGVYVGFESTDAEEFQVTKEEVGERVRKHFRTVEIEDYTDDDSTKAEFKAIIPVRWQSVLQDNNYGLLYYSFILKYHTIQLQKHEGQ